MIMEFVSYLEKINFIVFIINVNDLLFILERILYLDFRKIRYFIIKLKLVEVGIVFRNVIICCRG